MSYVSMNEFVPLARLGIEYQKNAEYATLLNLRGYSAGGRPDQPAGT
jgi:hypothetical protein